MTEVVLGIGTNEGNRLGLIRQAIQLLEKQLEELLAISSIYETKPWGFEADQDFYNLVAVYRTAKSVDELLVCTQAIEQQLGRQQKSTGTGYSSRPMDIDILFFGNKVINKHNLVVPHEKMLDRKFVMVPLSEVYGDFTHPLLSKKVKVLAELCSDIDEPKRVIDKSLIVNQQNK